MRALPVNIHRFGILLDKATPLLLIIVAGFFAYQNAGFQKDNRRILSDTRATVKNTERISQVTRDILKRQDKTVEELKADNKQQTLILCRLIIRSDTTIDLTPEEEDEVEGICEQEISRRSLTVVPDDPPLAVAPAPLQVISLTPRSSQVPSTSPGTVDAPPSPAPPMAPSPQPAPNLVQIVEPLTSPLFRLLEGL